MIRHCDRKPGVFFAAEKLNIMQLLLEELNVDRIEIASAQAKANFKE
jgi:hypothetical protein